MADKNGTVRRKGERRGRLPKSESGPPSLNSSLIWARRSLAEAEKHHVLMKAELERAAEWLARCEKLATKILPVAEALSGLPAAPSTTRTSITHKAKAIQAARRVRKGEVAAAA